MPWKLLHEGRSEREFQHHAGNVIVRPVADCVRGTHRLNEIHARPTRQSQGKAFRHEAIFLPAASIMFQQEFIAGINRRQRADSPDGASLQDAVSGARARLPRSLIPAHLESVSQDQFPMRALLNRGVQLDFWALLARELLGNGAFCLEERKARTEF